MSTLIGTPLDSDGNVVGDEVLVLDPDDMQDDDGYDSDELGSNDYEGYYKDKLEEFKKNFILPFASMKFTLNKKASSDTRALFERINIDEHKPEDLLLLLEVGDRESSTFCAAMDYAIDCGDSIRYAFDTADPDSWTGGTPEDVARDRYASDTPSAVVDHVDWREVAISDDIYGHTFNGDEYTRIN